MEVVKVISDIGMLKDVSIKKFIDTKLYRVNGNRNGGIRLYFFRFGNKSRYVCFGGMFGAQNLRRSPSTTLGVSSDRSVFQSLLLANSLQGFLLPHAFISFCWVLSVYSVPKGRLNQWASPKEKQSKLNGGENQREHFAFQPETSVHPLWHDQYIPTCV